MHRHNKVTSCKKKTSWPLLVFVCGLLILSCVITTPKIIYESSIAIREILDRTAPTVLSISFVSFTSYYILAYIIVFCCLAILILILNNYMTITYIKRDHNYLIVSLQNNSTRLPATTLDELSMRIIGPKSEQELDYYATIQNTLLDNIQPIKDFLKGASREDCILYIDSSWGTGKTTSVLIAIDQFAHDDNQEKQVRYIYESVFKYTNVVRDFQTDLLDAIQNTLYEFDIPKSMNIGDIIENMELEFPKSLLYTIKTCAHRQKLQLTGDYIQEINQWYTTKANFDIVVIIDDIDRLQGEEIVQTLSLISILRRLKFMRIIIPADSDAIVHHLSHIGIYQPKTFIQKYIPESSSICLKTSGEVIEPIILQKINSLQEKPRANIQIYKPALAAILFKAISDTLNNKAKTWNSYRFEWIYGSRRDAMNAVFKDNGVDSDSQYILVSALDHVQEALRTYKRLNQPNLTFPRYTCEVQPTNDARRFENILFSITREDDGAHKHKISDQFKREYYDDFIDSWIFNFAYQNWEILGLTLRTIFDIIQSQSLSNLSPHPNKQFQQVFNKLLGTEEFSIKISTNLI